MTGIAKRQRVSSVALGAKRLRPGGLMCPYPPVLTAPPVTGMITEISIIYFEINNSAVR